MSYQMGIYLGIATIIAYFGRRLWIGFIGMWVVSVGFTPIIGLLVLWFFRDKLDGEPTHLWDSLMSQLFTSQRQSLDDSLRKGEITKAEYDRDIDRLS